MIALAKLGSVHVLPADAMISRGVCAEMHGHHWKIISPGAAYSLLTNASSEVKLLYFG